MLPPLAPMGGGGWGSPTRPPNRPPNRPQNRPPNRPLPKNRHVRTGIPNQLTYSGRLVNWFVFFVVALCTYVPTPVLTNETPVCFRNVAFEFFFRPSTCGAKKCGKQKRFRQQHMKKQRFTNKGLLWPLRHTPTQTQTQTQTQTHNRSTQSQTQQQT